MRDNVAMLLNEAKIPMKIASIHEPDDDMRISSELPANISRRTALCIAGQKSFSVLRIHKHGINQIHGIEEKMFGVLSKRDITCHHYLTGVHRREFIIKNLRFDLHRNEIIDEITNLINPDSLRIEKGLSLIAVIGEGMGTVKGTFRDIFVALVNCGIKVKMVDQGADILSIIIGVEDEEYESAIKAIYDALIIKH